MAQRCVICGADISTPDYYATIRRKYCKACADAVKHRQKADYQAGYRERIRERNAVARQLCEAQRKVIDAQNAELIRMREIIRRYGGQCDE